MTNNGESAASDTPEIFTDRKDGVIPETNIKTDLMERAAEATDVMTANAIAKQDAKMKIVKHDDDVSGNSDDSGDSAESPDSVGKA